MQSRGFEISKQLFLHEIKTDLKRPAILAAGILQVLCTVYLCYIANITNPNVNPRTFNSLIWICLIFCTLQIMSKSFTGYSKGRWIFMNQLGSPNQIIIAKLIYNVILMLILTFLNFFLFSIFLGLPIMNLTLYATFLFFGGIGISCIFTMMAAIGSKTPSASFIIPVMSLPVLIPFINISIGGSLKCINAVIVPSTYQNLYALIGLDVLIVVLCMLLFSPLWRD